jgi:mannose-6-phosphate isomerase-like protein (cupin superfamily)
MDYVIIYRTAASHTVETSDAVKRVDVPIGLSYFRKAGVEHNVINSGDTEVVLVETELKG